MKTPHKSDELKKKKKGGSTNGVPMQKTMKVIGESEFAFIPDSS